jgi:hypothetical protein
MWKHRKNETLPLFAMIAGAHWIYFGLPLFWGKRSIATNWGEIIVSSDSITKSMVMALVGVAVLWAGMKVRFWRFSLLPDVPACRKKWTYLRAIMSVAMALSLWDGAQMLLGAGGWQIMVILTSVLPSAAFALLFRKHLAGESSYVDRVLIYSFIVTRIVLAGSSGWLSPLASLGVMVVSLYLSKRRRLPVVPVLLMLVAVLFLQVGKSSFRYAYWTGQAEGTRTERLQYWAQGSASKWGQVFAEQDMEAARDLAAQSLGRLNLLTDAAYVLERTPSLVPYQHGKTYSYLLTTLIPRFAWHNKSSVNEANRFYQIAYGLNNERTNVSRAVGFLAEGYMNFSWAGVIGIMFLMGMVLGLFQRTFLAPDSGLLFHALGIALLPPFLSIESQAAVYLAGFIQQVALTLMVMVPAIEIHHRSRTAARPVITIQSLQPVLQAALPSRELPNGRGAFAQA